MPEPLRRLIVNADDFGLSRGVNRGIIEAHERGIVTSASLMVLRPAAHEAADYAAKNPALGLGLHVELCEWIHGDDGWKIANEIVPADDAVAVGRETARQLALFSELTGTTPTHIDSHQHVHRSEPARSIFIAHAERLGVPLRSCSDAVRYCGDFYGQSSSGWPWHEGIGVEQLLRILDQLPPGVTELGCHPGFADDLDSVYRVERALEVASLCDARVKAAVEAGKIELVTFREVSR
jgi:predicted glycoside hydrolase/deacetylase ChbG (UPF0249 family)